MCNCYTAPAHTRDSVRQRRPVATDTGDPGESTAKVYSYDNKYYYISEMVIG